MLDFKGFSWLHFSCIHTLSHCFTIAPFVVSILVVSTLCGSVPKHQRCQSSSSLKSSLDRFGKLAQSGFIPIKQVRCDTLSQGLGEFRTDLGHFMAAAPCSGTVLDTFGEFRQDFILHCSQLVVSHSSCLVGMLFLWFIFEVWYVLEAKQFRVLIWLSLAQLCLCSQKLVQIEHPQKLLAAIRMEEHTMLVVCCTTPEWCHRWGSKWIVIMSSSISNMV